MAYIYKITNVHNGMVYIGCTNKDDPYDRFKMHILDSKKPQLQHRRFYQDINKYGADAFDFEVLEQTENGPERESYYINLYNSFYHGYNETLGGDGRRYIVLSETEICNYYLQNPNVTATAKYFGHDASLIRNILNRNNIPIKSSYDILKDRCSKPVAKLDKETLEVLAVYSSIREAMRQNNNETHIVAVCKGHRKTAGGYKWKYVE